MNRCAVPGCDIDEEEHHDFVAAVKAPDGCKCHPGDWYPGRQIPDVCPVFADDKTIDRLCTTCNHEEPCHAPKTESPTTT